MPFDGITYNRNKDKKRLASQLERVRVFMLDHRGGWYSLAELEQHLQIPQASLSARLRDLRKDKFGSHDVKRRRRTEGTWEYSIPKPQGTLF